MLRTNPKQRWALVLAATLLWAGQAESADLSVGNMAMVPGTTATVVVSGSIGGEATYGLTVMLELWPRANAVGNVAFTEAPPPRAWYPPLVFVEDGRDGPELVTVVTFDSGIGDIVQLGDAWPGVGSFTAFDTYSTRSPYRNGVVDDNGAFTPQPVVFSGPIASFPVFADARASGVWDVLLFSSVGSSEWEGVETVLWSGTIRVTREACARDAECEDGDPCTIDRCEAGVCVQRPGGADCRSGDSGSGSSEVDGVAETEARRGAERRRERVR